MKVKVLVQLAVILALLSPNSKSLLVEKARAEEPIKIGVTFPITGALSLYGEGFKNGVELAEAEINEGGGDDGRRLEIIVADNQSDPKVAISDAKRFFDADTVSGMLSGFDFLTLPIVPILEKKRGYCSQRRSTDFRRGRFRNLLLPVFGTQKRSVKDMAPSQIGRGYNASD